TAKVIVQPDPRVKQDLTAQNQFVLQIRDDFAKLAGTVQQLRAVRRQLETRNDLIAGQAKYEPLTKSSRELVSKLDALEEKLHNPEAKVTYDVFAAKGGAKLYWQFAFLFETVKE